MTDETKLSSPLNILLGSLVHGFKAPTRMQNNRTQALQEVPSPMLWASPIDRNDFGNFELPAPLLAMT